MQTTTQTIIPTPQDVKDSIERVRPYVHRTPVLTSETLNGMAGCELYFKCENFQKMGAFKMRGAINAILQLSEEQRAKGVATHSSGNFAQALSLAARMLGAPAYIVMPENAPSVKKAAVEGYGGKVIICPSTIEDRERTVEEVVNQTGATFIHPSNDTNVILGQGTSCAELLEDHPDLDAVVTPVGGGGLIAGTALNCTYRDRPIECWGGEPLGSDDAYRSLELGHIVKPENPQTMADGLRTHLGDKNFPIIQEMVSGIIRVSEEDILRCMHLIWERMKIVVEANSAVALAAVMTEPEHFRGKKVGIILSGGNVDLGKLPF